MIGREPASAFTRDADELERRMGADSAERARRGLAERAKDPHLLAAMRAGLPDCAGVAVGLDRLFALAMGARSLDEVLAFPIGRA